MTDFSLHGCYTDDHVGALGRIGELIELGTRTIKVYTTYRDKLMASDTTIAEVMRALSEVGGMIYVHAEDDDLVVQRMSELGREGPVPFQLITDARPVEAETIATLRILDLARAEDAACYFVHQASPDAVEAVRLARRDGAHAFSEVCPHYLLLDDSRYIHVHGSRYTCCPPLRSPEVRERLMQLVLEEVADVIASDHCAFHDRHKSPNEQDLDHMPFGMPGVQTRVPIALSALYGERGLAMGSVVRYLSTRPAQLNGLYPQKGVLAVGSDADILVWDERGVGTIAAEDLLQDSDYSPFEGLRVTGSLSGVYLRGAPVHEAVRAEHLRAGRFVRQSEIVFAEA